MNEHQWGDEHEEALLVALREKGASKMMRRIVQERSVACRHSVLEEFAKWHSDDGDIIEAVETAQRLGGGFFQKVWDGELFDALLHADGNNARIISEAFERDEVIAASDQPADYTIKMVQERYIE